MNVELYYFSGTGNSLVIARDIVERISGKVVSIASQINKEQIITDADAIGIVFPVYHQGIPLIVRRFVNKMDNLEEKYIFAICTHGGGPGIAIEYFDKIIKSNGGRLAAGFAVKMPYNYITPSSLKDFYKSFVLREVAIEKQQKMFSDWKSKLNYICEFIGSRKEGKFETDAKIIEYLVDYFNLRNTLQKSVWLKVAGFKGYTDMPFYESIQLMDYGFIFDSKCNSCGVCTKICPVNNIVISEGRPLWQHHCEQCFACLQWCPREAIQFGNNTSQGKRYHHPDVKLSDMICADK